MIGKLFLLSLEMIQDFKKHFRLAPAPARIILFLVSLLIIWLPLAIPIYLSLEDENTVSILTMSILFIEFIFALVFLTQKIYDNPKGLGYYGLVGSRKNGVELVKGLSIGLVFCWALFIVESLLGWVIFQPVSHTLLKVVIEGLIVGIGVAFAEELFFRGWILTELEQDYSPQIALVSNALIFASLHFLKPLSEVIRTLPQFPALVLLGLTLVWAKRTHGHRLGICIGIHGGLVWGYYILKVGKLTQYTDQVSPWITGIDGNPIAGVMGILFLGILAIIMTRKSFK